MRNKLFSQPGLLTLQIKILGGYTFSLLLRNDDITAWQLLKRHLQAVIWRCKVINSKQCSQGDFTS